MLNNDPDKFEMKNSLTKRSKKQDLLIATCLFLITLFTRVPFANKMLYQGDSARFAMAMKHYDVSQMRPHAPGYVLYVGAAKIADFFVHNETVSLVLVSILASALTIFVFYHLSSRMFGRSVGIISSLLLISSPLFWFNGEMPLTYALEGFLSVSLVYCCYRLICGEEKWLFISAVILGLLTGVRQNMAVMLLPLWMFAIRKNHFKKILVSFFVFGLTCFFWFIPMVALTGGLSKYLAAVNAQYKTWVLHPGSFFFEIKGRGWIFSNFIVHSLWLGLVPLFYYFVRYFRIKSIIKDVRILLILFWIIPPVFFFIGVNVFNSGHVLFILPPLFILIGESIKRFSKDISSLSNNLLYLFSYKAVLIPSVILLLLVNCYIFLFGNTQVSYSAIKKGDDHLAEAIRLTKNNTIFDKTMILTFVYNTQAGYYLPDYVVYCPFPLMFDKSEVPIEAQNIYVSFNHQTNPKTYWTNTGFSVKPIPVADGIEMLVVWENDIARYFQNSDRPLKQITSDLNEAKIYTLELKPGDEIIYDYHFWTVKQGNVN